jgi:hypothetical protein
VNRAGRWRTLRGVGEGVGGDGATDGTVDDVGAAALATGLGDLPSLVLATVSVRVNHHDAPAAIAATRSTAVSTCSTRRELTFRGEYRGGGGNAGGEGGA